MKLELNNKLRYSLYAVLVVVFLSSCSGENAKYVCNCEQLEKVQGFIERSIKPSNNMSDEEMEDVIHQLWVTGVKTTCQKRVFPTDSHNNIDWSEAKVDSCETAYDWVY